MKRDRIPDHGHNLTLTREEAMFRATVADTCPPALVDLLDLLDELAFDEVHLVVLLCLVIELHDRAEPTSLRAYLRCRGRRGRRGRLTRRRFGG